VRPPLAAIMGRGLRGARRAALHVACLQRLLTAARAREVDPATADLLADVVTTYLPGAPHNCGIGRRAPADPSRMANDGH